MSSVTHGVLLVDKPGGISSFQAVSMIKKALRGTRTGHSGTLDPMATGLLVVLAGEATKIAPYLEEEPKEYLAVMRLGLTTDTYDLDGEVTGQRPVEADESRIRDEIEAMAGRQMQVPPPYSAVKLKGKPLYRYAREGREVKVEAREIEVFRLEVEGLEAVGDFRDVECVIACSRGTYIRSLCHEAGRRLGCGATLARLRRTRAGRFSVDGALSPEEWRERLERGGGEGVISIAEALAHLPSVRVEGRTAGLVRNGHPVESAALRGLPAGLEHGGALLVTDGGGLPLALHALEPGGERTRTLRVFNLPGDGGVSGVGVE